MVKLIKDTEEETENTWERNGERGDKECGSLLDKDANRVNLNWNR